MGPVGSPADDESPSEASMLTSNLPISSTPGARELHASSLKMKSSFSLMVSCTCIDASIPLAPLSEFGDLGEL